MQNICKPHFEESVRAANECRLIDECQVPDMVLVIFWVPEGVNFWLQGCSETALQRRWKH